MSKKSLFGYMAAKLSKHQENLATESLNYIITQSPNAAQGFLNHITQTTGINLPEQLSFRTQPGGTDGSTPDLEGIDADGQKRLVVEAKFWAGLTENQPNTYLKRLSRTKSSALVFISPEKRLLSLWPELLRRCKLGKVSFQQTDAKDLCIKIDGKPNALALTSWRALLSSILHKVNAVGETETSSDVIQLQGLCETMDTDAFYPISSEELSTGIARRIFQYKDLVDGVTDQLRIDGLASTKRLKEYKPYGAWGRYMIIHDYACCLAFDCEAWKILRETPFWFSVQGKDWKFSHEAKRLLSSLEKEQPPRLLVVGNWLEIPLSVPTGVEKDEVMRSLISQIKAIAKKLSAGGQTIRGTGDIKARKRSY
jgi:hypothetical protein